MEVRSDRRRRAPCGPYGRTNPQTGKPELTEEGQRLVAEDYAKYPHPWVLLRRSYPELYRASRICFSEEDIDALCLQARTKAAVHFDPSRGYQFNTYALLWTRAIVGKAYRARSKAFTAGKKELALNRPVGRKDGDREFGDTIAVPDRVAEEAARRGHCEALQSKIRAALRRVEPKERRRDMFLYRNGFVTGEAETLEVTSQQFGITRERVRQIVASIYRKIEPYLEEIYHDHLSPAA